MSFGSILKLSFHNLFQNKLRTTLTLLVLFVMSFIVMFIAGFGFSFYDTANANINAIFQEEGTYFSISKLDVSSSSYQYLPMSVEEVDGFLSRMEEEDGLFTTLDLGQNGRSYGMLDDISVAYKPFAARYNPFLFKDDYLKAGRMWDKSDENSNNVWLSDNLIDSFQVGQKVRLGFSSEQFTVAGFIAPYNTNYYYDSEVWLDYHHSAVPAGLQSSGTAPVIFGISSYLLPEKELNYGVSVTDRLKKIVKELNTFDEKKSPQGFQVSCGIVEEMKMINIVMLAVTAAVLVFGAIVILLSIGSVSNTIKITVEQNRKFFGMMKAIGMRNGSVRAVVNWQTVIMTIAGVLVATGAVIGAIIAIKPTLSLLTKSMFGTDQYLVCTLSPFIPIVTIVAIIGFIFLFTRSSLRSISRMDVISVISEVN